MKHSHPFDGKSVHNPVRFQQEFLDDREKNFFKKNYLGNNSFTFKYKKKLAGSVFNLRNDLLFNKSFGLVTNKTGIEFSANKNPNSDFELNGSLDVERKQPKMSLHLHYKPDNQRYSVSSSLSGETNKLKDVKISSTYRGGDYKVKLQLSKYFAKKQSNRSWDCQLITTKSLRSFALYKNGLDIVHEGTLFNRSNLEGLTLFKFGASSQRNFGFLVAHKIKTNPWNLRVENFTFFYNIPEALLTLSFKDIKNPLSNLSALILTRYTKKMEVGVLLNQASQKTRLQFGVSQSFKTGKLKFKLDEKLDFALSYTYNIRKNVTLCFGSRFGIGDTLESLQTRNSFPFGIKLEIKDE